MIPCVQVLAHIKGIFRHWEYKEINDIDDILLVGDERTYRLIEHIFQTLAECFSSRRVNIGMDEAYLLGRGKFSDEHGFPKKFDILLSHLKKVSEIANKYGFHPMMWSDMFFRPVNDGDYYGKNYGMNSVPENIRKKVPENIELVYWEYFQTESKYYDRMIERHKEFDKPFYYAGGVSCWTGFVPNNRYAIETLRAAVHSCQKYGEVRKRRKSTLWDMIFQKNGRATGENHWHKCSRCDAIDGKAAHSGGEATCSAKAKCEVCGAEYGEIDAKNHTLKAEKQKTLRRKPREIRRIGFAKIAANCS